jgi:hypothetical protein
MGLIQEWWAVFQGDRKPTSLRVSSETMNDP